jgi:acetyl esterase/lipase
MALTESIAIEPAGATQIETRAWGLIIAAALVALLTAIVVVSLFTGMTVEFLYYVRTVVLGFPLHVLIITVLAAAVAFAAGRGRRFAFGFSVLSAVASAAVALIPVMTQVTAAHDYGVSLSIKDYVDNAFRLNLAKPDPERTVRYATIDGHELLLDVWRTNAPPPHPAIVKIHGGGWISGDRGQTYLWDGFLDDLGFDVFDVEYRMVRDVAPGTDWQASVGDTKCAVGWVAAHATEYGVDPARISTFGGSAGGHLSLLTAYSAGSELKSSCNLGEPRVKSAIAFYPPTDLIDYAEGPQTNAVGLSLLRGLLGGSVGEYRDRYRVASPITYVSRDSPPTLSVQGIRDQLVPVRQTALLDAALSRAGVRHEVVYLPWTDHSFDGSWGNFATQIARAKVAEFLKRHAS